MNDEMEMKWTVRGLNEIISLHLLERLKKTKKTRQLSSLERRALTLQEAWLTANWGVTDWYVLSSRVIATPRQHTETKAYRRKMHQLIYGKSEEIGPNEHNSFRDKKMLTLDACHIGRKMQWKQFSKKFEKVYNFKMVLQLRKYISDIR